MKRLQTQTRWGFNEYLVQPSLAGSYQWACFFCWFAWFSWKPEPLFDWLSDCTVRSWAAMWNQIREASKKVVQELDYKKKLFQTFQDKWDTIKVTSRLSRSREKHTGLCASTPKSRPIGFFPCRLRDWQSSDFRSAVEGVLCNLSRRIRLKVWENSFHFNPHKHFHVSHPLLFPGGAFFN